MSKLAAPRSLESERAVLAAILLDPALLPRIADALKEDDFYDEKHQAIYRAMRTLDAEPDLRTLQAALEHAGTFEAVGGLSYLAGLDVDLPDLGRIDAYIEIVKDRALRRRLIRYASSLAKDSVDGAARHGVELLSSAEASLREIAERVAVERLAPVVNFRHHLDAFFGELAQQKVGGTQGIPTGLTKLDKVTLGLHAGQWIVIAGRPGMGKSIAGLQFCREAAFRQRRTAAFVSCEMAPIEQVRRTLAAETGIEHNRIRGNYLNESERLHLHEAGDKLAGWELNIEDAVGWRLSDVERRARAAHRRYGLDLLVVDHLGLIRADGQHRSENDRVNEVSLGLKNLARELGIPIVALAQLSRECERRPDKRPLLSDLRDSGSIEQHADVVIFIYRDSYYDSERSNDPLCELIVAKQRDGETGTVKVNLRRPLMRFENLDDGQRVLGWQGGA